MNAFIQDAIRETVAEVSTAMLTSLQAVDPNITAVHYIQGSGQEIDSILANKDRVSSQTYKKYPCVMLVEDVGYDVGRFFTEANLRLAIAVHTQYDYSSEKRDTVTMRAILWPIYNALFAAIAQSKYFNVMNDGEMSHTVYERKLWSPQVGEKKENTLTSWVDALDITNLKLKFNNHKIC